MWVISAFDLQFCMATCILLHSVDRLFCLFVCLFVHMPKTTATGKKMHYSLSLILFDRAQLIRNTIYRLWNVHSENFPICFLLLSRVSTDSCCVTVYVERKNQHLSIIIFISLVNCFLSADFIPIQWIHRIWSTTIDMCVCVATI